MADEPQTPAETPQEPADSPPPPGPEDELAGLDEHARRLVDRANAEAAGRRKRVGELGEQLTALQRKHETEQEKRDREISERERAAGRAERDEEVAALRREIVAEQIRAMAAGRFADPEDTVLYLDVDQLVAVPEKQRRGQQIQRALEDLLERKPHLGTRQSSGVVVSQGARSAQPDGRRQGRSWLRG